MNKALLAYFLACVTVAALLSSFTLIAPGALLERPVQVNIQSDQPVADIVTAVESLHRTDIDVHTSKNFQRSSRTKLFMIPMMALGFMLITGLVLLFYKLYCRWLGIAPSL